MPENICSECATPLTDWSDGEGTVCVEPCIHQCKKHVTCPACDSDFAYYLLDQNSKPVMVWCDKCCAGRQL